MPIISDKARLSWLSAKMAGRRVMVSTSRSTGLVSVHNINGDTKGGADIREAIDREMEAERRERLGFKR